MCKKCKCCSKLPWWSKILIATTGIFGLLFTVYFFNLDMKLTAMMEPWLLKWYDHVDRDKHL